MTIGYQTLADRDNPWEVARDGPFLCNRENAWLSPGYYFWDRSLKRAHAWGEMAYGGRYIICQADLHPERLLDLVGDPEQQEDFQELIETLRNHQDLQGYPEPPLNKVIALLRRLAATHDPTVFPYDAVREQDFPPQPRYRFVAERQEWTYLRPRVQICLFEKNAATLSNFRIVHPAHYVGAGG